MFDPNNPRQIPTKAHDDIKQAKTLRMYDEITQMLDIFYPGFWKDKDKDFQIAWVAKVDEITKRFYPRRQRGTLEIMALVCAIIGTDFESNPNFQFIVDKLESEKVDLPLSYIFDYLRFVILKKDYNPIGIQYNNWSMRGVEQGMPRITRHIPDFDHEWKPDNPDENVWGIYIKTVRNGGKENKP